LAAKIEAKTESRNATIANGGGFQRRSPMAEVLMKLSRLPAEDLESVPGAVIEQPEGARKLAI
jgi:hypothetical protein